MPRIAQDGDEIDAYFKDSDDGSCTWDVCAECWDTYWEQSIEDFEPPLKAWNGEPTDVATVNIEADTWIMYGDDDYTCDCCGKQLDPMVDA